MGNSLLETTIQQQKSVPQKYKSLSDKSQIIIIIIIIPSFYIAPFKTPKVALHNICVSVCEYVGVCLWTLEAKSVQKEMGFKVLFKDGQ